jgi:hypothetical protein
MSYRANDRSPELTLMAAVIVQTYLEWGYPVPEPIAELSMGLKAPIS